jgi:glycosyltransferase involved in cell wall biosynthesis
VDPAKVELCPNAIEIRDMSVTPQERTALRRKYGLPLDKKIFVYGGNLGKPQGIPYIIDCLKAQQSNPDAFFLVVGEGTEYAKLEAYVNEEKPENVKLLKLLPKEDYDRMVAACDVGLIFLDPRFTIPNFPSRLLAYMQAGVPVLACTDPNTDMGKIIVEGGFGWWCRSDDADQFSACVEQACQGNFDQMKANCAAYLKAHYDVKLAVNTIEDFLNT